MYPDPLLQLFNYLCSQKCTIVKYVLFVKYVKSYYFFNDHQHWDIDIESFGNQNPLPLWAHEPKLSR